MGSDNAGSLLVGSGTSELGSEVTIVGDDGIASDAAGSVVIGSATELISDASITVDSSGVTAVFCGFLASFTTDVDDRSDSGVRDAVVKVTGLESSSDDTVRVDNSALELTSEGAIVSVAVGSGTSLSSGIDVMVSTGNLVLNMNSDVASSVVVGSELDSSMLEMGSDVATSVTDCSKLGVVSGNSSVVSVRGSSVLEITSDVAASVVDGMALDSGSVTVTSVAVGTRLDMLGVSETIGVSLVETNSDVDGDSSCRVEEVDWNPSVVGTITTGIDVSGTSSSGSWVSDTSGTSGTSGVMVWFDHGCCRLFKRLYRRAVRLSRLPKTSSKVDVSKAQNKGAC